MHSRLVSLLTAATGGGKGESLKRLFFFLSTLQLCKCDYTQILFSSLRFHNGVQTLITSHGCNHCWFTKQGIGYSALLYFSRCSSPKRVPENRGSKREACPRPRWDVSNWDCDALTPNCAGLFERSDEAVSTPGDGIEPIAWHTSFVFFQ